jgi:hypothetical protein
MQCMPDGQYSQVRTPLSQKDFVTSFGPRPVLITDVTTYLSFCHSIVFMVPPPFESGSIHAPAKPGIASWPEVDGEVATGAVVASGATVAVGVGMRELHEHAMITNPAMAPMSTSQNFLRISISFLLFRKICRNKYLLDGQPALGAERAILSGSTLNGEVT